MTRDQIVVYGRNSSHIEAEKRGKTDQSHAQALGIANTTIWNVLKKEINHWWTQTRC